MLLSIMVGFNVNLPQIRIASLGSLSWRIVLIALINMGKCTPAVRGTSGSSSDKKGVSEGSLFFHLLVWPPPLLRVDLPHWWRFSRVLHWLVEPEFLNVYFGIWTSSSPEIFSAPGGHQTTDVPCLVDCVTSCHCPQWRTAILRLFPLSRHPVMRIEYWVLSGSGVIWQWLLFSG